MHADPESVKVQLSHQYLFTLLGSAHVKTVLKMLMKLPPAAVAWCQHSQVFVRLFHRSEKERGRKREREREGEKGERWEGERGREREGKRGKERGREREKARAQLTSYLPLFHALKTSFTLVQYNGLTQFFFS